MAARLSDAPGELILWFRQEQVHMVTWGGDPNKPVDILGDDPSQLSPRRSFQAWHQLVELTSRPWSKADRAAARAVGASIGDVMLQFRSVRLLMANDRVNSTLGQLKACGEPIVICDRSGKVILATDAFSAILGDDKDINLATLPGRFADSREMERVIEDVTVHEKSWRGTVEILSGQDGVTPLLLRAEPIVAQSGDGLVGSVFLFLDLSEKTKADVSRRRFQQEVVERRRSFQDLTSTARSERDIEMFNRVLDNASIAALEIAAAGDLHVVPDVLRSLQSSVRRSADLIPQLDTPSVSDESRG